MVSQTQDRWRVWLLPGIVTLVSLVLLFGVMPYNLGYGQVPVSVSGALWYLWSLPDWEHGLFVPLIVGFLVYWKRDLWRSLPVKGSTRSGLAGLVLSMVLYWIGYKIDITAVGFLALHCFLGALIVWFLGWRWIWTLLFPFSFLIFAWPFPFLDSIAFQLRIVMSGLSHHFLNIIGIDNIRSGTAILSAPDYVKRLPQGAKFQLDVADPCSGIRSLFALNMVTALYAYVMIKETWKKWVVFACAAPLAILGNLGRIVMLTFGTLLLGPEVAIGSEEHPSTFHMLSGIFVFVVALGGMAMVGWLLESGGRQLWNRAVPFYREMIKPEKRGEQKR